MRDSAYFISEAAPLPVAHYQLFSTPEKVLFTLDKEGGLKGYLDASLFPPFSQAAASMKAGDAARNFVRSVYESDSYRDGRNIMAEYPSILAIPVLNANNIPVKVLRRWQLFFKDEYFKAVRTREPVLLPYPQYAVAIWRAANIASSVGEKRISVLEFGVAQGNGLLACELLAREIGRIWNVKIDVYGFDGGVGLPEITDYRDCPQCWSGGQFQMDMDALKTRLSDARLITGYIAETWPAFLEKTDVPVGCMLVDVDYYSSTVPILHELPANKTKFLPIVNMYFDDIGGSLQFQGEALAIRKFNEENEKIKISPEAESFGEFNFGGRRYGFSKLKACLFYDHPGFCDEGFKSKIMHDFWR